MKFSIMIFDRSKRKKGMDSFEIFQSMRDFFFLLRGGVYSVENFVRQFICPLSLLDREVGLIAE